MIVIKVGDITQEEADAIVNAANSSLTGGGGVDGAIHRAAGPSVLEECLTLGGCNTGEAIATNPGKLKVKKIIHTVGPRWMAGKVGEAAQLKKCYDSTFALAKKLGLKTLAFPSIATGAYGFPIEPAAEIALRTGLAHEKDFEEIRYICFTAEDGEIYEATLKHLKEATAGK